MKLLLALLLFFHLPATGEPGETVAATLTVDNVATNTGTLWVGIYESPQDFLDREHGRLVSHHVTGTGRQHIYVDGLVVGKTYAVAVFHDENDNGELDTNLLGLPAEPWAFSRSLQSWLRKPRFEEMSFVFEPAGGLPILSLR